MAVFCSKCGKELSDSAAFCPECGTQVNRKDEAHTDNVSAVAATSGPQLYQGTNSASSNVTPNTPASSVSVKNSVSTAMFFGLDFVFALPFIGLIVCIVMAFAPENETLKHFARAKLIWIIIGVVISVITIAVIAVLGFSFGDWIARYAYSVYY